jgi:DnaJ-class molecular chaperone
MAKPHTTARQPGAKDGPVCKGAGEVSRTVHVGRKRRAVGEQAGLCLNCFGTGQTPD